MSRPIDLGASEAEIRRLTDQVLTRWRRSEIEIRPGATDSDFLLFERRYGLGIPSDLRFFLHVANGMDPNDLDPVEQIRFWPIEEIKPVSEEFPNDPSLATLGDVFLFSDYSLWAHGYGLRLSRAPGDVNLVLLIGDEDPRPVASSFGEFVKKYLYEPSAIF